MQKADKNTLKLNNRHVILNSLKRMEQSRTDLAEKTGLSNSTVSSLVSDLMEQGTVFEKEVAQSSGGRRPVLLALNPSAAFTLVIKIVPLKIIVSLVDLTLAIVYSREFPYDSCCEESVQSAISQSLRAMADESSSRIDKIAGIGLNITGVVDYPSGVILYSSHLKVQNFEIRSIIQHEINRSVHIFKDTDAMMLGECIRSKLDKDKNYIYILADNGVGLSFMHDGDVLHFHCSGFELGHLQLESSGPQCTCGKYGCVESFVSGNTAMRDLTILLNAAGTSNTSEYDHLDFRRIVAKSNEGDKYCVQVLTNQCKYLGKAIALATNIFVPDKILIGGPLAKADWNICEIIKKAISEHVINLFEDRCVTLADTDEKSCTQGLADKVFEREFFANQF